MNHTADVRKKVLSHTQIRVMAEMYAEQAGWKDQIKRGMSINDDGTLHIIDGGTGKFVDIDLNNLNIAMGALEWWHNDSVEHEFRRYGINQDVVVLEDISNTVMIEWKRDEIPLPIAIASALMKITKE